MTTAPRDPYHSPEIRVEQEMAMDDAQRMDVFSAVSGLVTTLPKSPASATEYEAQINDVQLHSGFVPPHMREDLRGVDFGRLDVSITGIDPARQDVNLKLFSRRLNETNRIITLSKSENEDYMEVSDSHAELIKARGVSLNPYVERAEVALYLALQALRDPGEARDFTLTHGPQSLTAAASLLTAHAKSKVISITSGQQIRFSSRRTALLHTQSVAGFSSPESLFHEPTHVMHSAWLVEKHNPILRVLKGTPIVRRTYAEYSPTNNMRPHPVHDDTESFRVELSANAETDPRLLEAELGRVVLRSCGRLRAAFTRANQLFYLPRKDS
ncbi:MAG: hypothetical protein QFB87_01620 [Patescibacteria group bacterium]|nr:hypothetical protein [Patescibacteria group bacterium]